MSLDAGSVVATLGGRFSPTGFNAFGNAMYKARSDMESTEKRAQLMGERSSRSMQTMGTAAKYGLVGAMAGVGAIFVYSAKKAADFQQELSSLQSVTKASAREMGLLRKQALDAGAATKYSALQAAQAQTALAKGGLSTAQILKGGLKGALALASAGEMDLADAANTTANALNLFGLDGSRATHVADAFAMAANKTTADVHFFAEGLAQGGAAAKAAGLTFDETTAALEVLAANGFKSGSDAGTSLKTTLAQLGKPTKQAADEAKRLGLSFFDARGNMKPLPAIAQQLHDVFGKLTKQQQLNAATTIAGTDGMRALIALSASGGPATQKFINQLKEQGTAAQVAAEKQDNLKGRIENMMGSIETAGIQIGTHFLPVLERGAEQVTAWVNHLAETGQLDDFAQGLISGGEEAVHVLRDLAVVGGDVSHVLIAVGRALDVGDASHIEAMVAALVGFKAVQFIGPMVVTFASQLGTLLSLTRVAVAGGELAALPGLFAMGITPLGAVGLAAGALAAGLVILGSRESGEARIARESAEAHNAQAAAIKSVMDAEMAAADKGLAAKQSTIDHKKAVQDLNQLRKDGKKGTDEWTEAVLREEQTSLRAAAAHNQYADAVKKQRDENRGAVAAAAKSRREALETLAKTQKDLGGYSGPVLDPNLDGKLSVPMRRYAAAIKAVEQANTDYIQALARSEVSELSRRRLMESSTQITARNAEGVARLIDALADVPAGKQTKILLHGDQDALARVGKLISTVHDAPSVKRIHALLAGDESVKTKFKAITAIAKGVPQQTVAKILTNAKTEEDAIHRLQVAIDGLRGKRVENTVTTVHKDVQGPKIGLPPLGRNSPTRRRAAGRPAGAAEDALIGEGAAPEWRVNAQTGMAYKTKGAEFAALGPYDYVIPLEDRYRGRALGLMAMLAQDLGVPGYAKGKAPKKKGRKHRFVPAHLDPISLPVEDFEARVTKTKAALDKSKQLAKNITTANASVRDIRRRKPSTAQERANKADDLRRAKKHVTDLHQDRAALPEHGSESRLRADLAQRRKELAEAKRNAERIKRQQTLADSAADQMRLADLHDDDAAYEKARGQRDGALKKLRKLLDDARAAAEKAKHGDYALALGNQIGKTDVDITENEQAKPDASETEASRTADTGMTDAERARLLRIDRDISLAGLTAGLEDDAAAAGEKVSFLEQVLQEVLADPAGRGGDAVIADIADQLKSARDNVTSLTAPATTTSGGGDLTQQVQQQLASYDQQQRELFGQFGSNFMELGGSRFFGAGKPQVNVTNNYQEPPADPHTWSRNLVFDLEAAVG